MKRTLYYLTVVLALMAGLMAWQRQERNALVARLASLRQGNDKLAEGLRIASINAEVQKAAEQPDDGEDESLAAVQAALKMPAGPERDAALIAAQLENLKPENALDALNYISGSRAREQALTAIFSHWAGKDPAAAAAASAKMADPIQRLYAQRAMLSKWSENQPGAALAWAQTLPDGVFKEESIETIAKQWAENDLPKAVAWLQQAPAGATWDAVFRTVSASWAGQKPAAALDFLFSLPTGPLVNDTIAVAVTTYAKTDAAAASAYVMRIPDVRSQNTAAKAVGDAWSAKDWAAAQQWATSLPEGGGRNNAIAGVASGWSAKDQQAALNWVQDLPEGDTRDSAIYAIVTRLFFRLEYPQQTAAIAATMKAGGDQEMVDQGIAPDWAMSDPDQATQWVDSLPAGGGHDAACWRLAIGLNLRQDTTAEQYAKAAPVVMSNQSSGMRKDGMQRIAEGWLKLDYPAASAWLAQTDLPDNVKQQLLQSAVPAK